MVFIIVYCNDFYTIVYRHKISITVKINLCCDNIPLYKKIKKYLSRIFLKIIRFCFD